MFLPENCLWLESLMIISLFWIKDRVGHLIPLTLIFLQFKSFPIIHSFFLTSYRQQLFIYMHPFLHPYKLQTTVIHSYSSIHPCLQVTEDSYSYLFKLQTTAIHLYSTFHPSSQVTDNSYSSICILSSILTSCRQQLYILCHPFILAYKLQKTVIHLYLSYRQQLFIYIHPFILPYKLQTTVIHSYLFIHPCLQVTNNSYSSLFIPSFFLTSYRQ